VFYQNSYFMSADALTCSFDGFTGATLNGLTSGPQLLRQAIVQLTNISGMAVFVKQANLPCASQFAVILSDNSEW
jgi:hypothetical protein